MIGQKIIGTDTRVFTQVGEVQIWKTKDGTRWDLWIDNVLCHCSSSIEVISRLTEWLDKKEEVK